MIKWIFLIGFWAGINSASAQNYSWQEIQTPVKASLRGLSPVSDQVVWASGSGGTWLRTLDGGKTWDHGVIAGLDTVDFRSIHAFDGNTALAASAGQPAVIYRTEDGGRSWVKVHEEGKEAFFDAIAFSDKRKGYALGDPVGGNWMILETVDGGKSWQSLTNLPKAEAGEAAFAASSSSMIAKKDQLMFATGGSISNLHFYSFSKAQWTKEPISQIAQGESSQGVFAITEQGEHLILVGGDYLKPKVVQGNLVLRSHGVFSIPSQSTSGYRSGIASLRKPNLLVAVGPDGWDYSLEEGIRWVNFSNVGFHAVKSSPDKKHLWASGSQGRIGKFIK
ncbi:MAG: photosystem II stability/assembly factor-like protein [Algoriphagus sp.]|nr:photosystem II stability/assembly factor-like protein [Algoriphagus sp.]